MDKHLIAFFKGNWITLTVSGLILKGAAVATNWAFLGGIVDVFANAFHFLADLGQ